VSVHVHLSRLSLCGPVMDWRPVQGVPRLSPDDRWDRLQPPRDPTDGLSGYSKWMVGGAGLGHERKPISEIFSFCNKQYSTRSFLGPLKAISVRCNVSSGTN